MAFTFFGKKQEEDIPDEKLLDMAMGGDGAKALAIAEVKVAAAAKAHGEQSGAHANALFVLSEVCLGLRLLPRAIGTLRQATQIRSDKPEDERNRLTYLMNLGDYLTLAGKLEEALVVHQESIDGRRKFYGEDHPGLGFGLDSWANTAIALGRYAEASNALRQAMNLYQKHGHERFSRALALLMLASAGKGDTIQLSSLPAEHASAALDTLLSEASTAKAVLLYQALLWLEPWLEDPTDRKRGWAQVQRRATEEADPSTAVAALEKLLELAEKTGDKTLAIDAEQGLGIAYERMKDAPKATAYYESAEKRARALGSPPTLARTLRNAGLYFAHGSDVARGARMLEEAAGLAGGETEAARAKVAWGIHLQHQGDKAKARAQLSAALRGLDPAHPDAVCAASHLKALDGDQGCGCGKPSAELDAQVERLIRERLPADLLEAVEVREGEVSVRVSRELTDTEARFVADAVELAQAELRRKINSVYG